MARKTKEEAEETKKAIALAALDTFCEKGYSKTTFDEIAKRINLTKGAVYWHFRNKADILSDLIRKSFEISRHQLSKEIPVIDGLDTLRRYMLQETLLVENYPTYRKFLFFVIYQMEWSEAIINKVGKDVQDVMNYTSRIIKEALTLSQKNGEISPDANIEETTDVIAAMWSGIMQNIIKPSFNIDPVRLINASFDLITNGLKDKRSENEVR